METPIALHRVAHRVSNRIPAESETSRQNRATPPQIKVSHLSPDPPVAGRGPRRGGGSRRAGGGYRGTFGFRKRIALQGGVAATLTPVALLCATKPLPEGLNSRYPLNFLEPPSLNPSLPRSIYNKNSWSRADHTMRAAINIFRIPGDFLTCMYSY